MNSGALHWIHFNITWKVADEKDDEANFDVHVGTSMSDVFFGKFLWFSKLVVVHC